MKLDARSVKIKQPELYFYKKMVRAANILTNAEDWTQCGTKALEKSQMRRKST